MPILSVNRNKYAHDHHERTWSLQNILSAVNPLHGQIVRSQKWGRYNLSSDWTNPFRFGPISPEFSRLSPHKCYAGTACAHLCTTMKEAHSILPLQT